MPKVSEEHREAMRERILDAALRCVARKGFTSTSMADIISEAGLSAGAVYVYYRGKEQLIVDVGRRVLGEKLAVLDELSRGDPVPAPHEVIPGIMASVSSGEFFPGIAVQVWGEAVHTGELRQAASRIIGTVTAGMSGYLAAWIGSSRGLPLSEAQAEAEKLAPAVVGLIQGYMVQLAFCGDAIRERYMDAAREVLAGML